MPSGPVSYTHLFLERLIAVALPRIRDFKGINEKFDGQGNYTLGITEQIIYVPLVLYLFQYRFHNHRLPLIDRIRYIHSRSPPCRYACRKDVHHVE